MDESAPNLAPYPILLRVPYLAEADRRPTRAVKKPAPEVPAYENLSSPPPVRKARRQAAPAPVVDEPPEEAPAPEMTAPEVKTPEEATPPPAKSLPTQTAPQNRRPAAPRKQRELVAFLLLVVVVGLCVHWHWAALEPYYNNPRQVMNLFPSRGPAEMVIVPGDGAPMLAEPSATPATVATPSCCTAENHACSKPTEAAPAEAVVVKVLEAMKPIEAGVAVPVEATNPVEAVVAAPPREPQRLPDSILNTPHENTLQPAKVRLVGPIVPVSATILKANFETPVNWMPAEAVLPAAAAEVDPNAPPVEADFGNDILPIDEGSTP